MTIQPWSYQKTTLWDFLYHYMNMTSQLRLYQKTTVRGFLYCYMLRKLLRMCLFNYSHVIKLGGFLCLLCKLSGM